MRNGININKTLLAATALVLSASATSAYAASGTVEFTGEIYQSACTVTTATKDQTVNIGRYPTSAFPAIGATSGAKAFTIDLENCEPGDYTLRFDGPMVAGHSDLLSVSVAKGVGIEILDNEEKTFPIGQTVSATDLAYVTIPADGETATFNLKARYRSFEDSVTEGEANASTSFTIEYR